MRSKKTQGTYVSRPPATLVIRQCVSLPSPRAVYKPWGGEKSVL